MKRVYLNGQRTFGNRGCEAIVRSTVAALREAYGDVRVLVPSIDIPRDSRQWPEAPDHGVEFVPAYQPRHTRYWVHAQRLPIPALKRAGWPFPFPGWVKKQIASVDVVLSVGGDNYSLDYRLPSLLMGMDGLAMDMGKPVILWGASVGPFEREPHFVPAIRRHLARMDRILVREGVSFAYLTETLGLNNVSQMVDPAFILEPESIADEGFWPEASEQGVVGLNVSPLIERYKKPGQSLLAEVEAFIRATVDRGFSVLLIPHVMPLDGSRKNNDADYMDALLERCADIGSHLSMTPRTLNAAQIKSIISKLRFFVGARTHATIAALSMGVPTVSIAYSVKARGINRDLFGEESMVLPTPDLTGVTLESALDSLVERESAMKATLQSAMPDYRQRVPKALPKDGSFDG